MSGGPEHVEDDLLESSPMRTSGADEANHWLMRYAGPEVDSEHESDDLAYEMGDIEESEVEDAPDQESLFKALFKSSVKAVRSVPFFAQFYLCDKRLDTASIVVDEAYRDIVHVLCKETDTLDCEVVVNDLLLDAVAVTNASALLKGLTSRPANSMLIELPWTPVTRLCACYWLLADSILDRIFCEPGGDRVTYENMVLAWQYLLDDSLRDHQAASGNWLANHVSLLERLASAAPLAPMRNDETSLYMRALKRAGIMHLAWELVEDKDMSQIPGIREYVKEKGDYGKRVVHQRSWLTLAGIDPDILESLIRGRLCQDYCAHDSPVRRALSSTSHSRPGIYVNSLADAIGVPPSPAHWEAVCNVMQQYLAMRSHDRNDAEAKLIDRAISPIAKWKEEFADEGLRRYLDPLPRGESEASFVVHHSHVQLKKHRRDKVRLFIANMRARITREGREKTMPMHHAVVEVGYATNPRERLRSHLQHVSSNYLMNLAEAVFQHLYPNRFQLWQFVIFNCWQREQCWLGEILVTQLAQGYTKSGHGFNYHPAGTSNKAAFFNLVQHNVWLQYEQDQLENDEFVDVLTRSRKTYEDYCEAQEKEAKKQEDLELLVEVLEGCLEYGRLSQGISRLQPEAEPRS